MAKERGGPDPRFTPHWWTLQRFLHFESGHTVEVRQNILSAVKVCLSLQNCTSEGAAYVQEKGNTCLSSLSDIPKQVVLHFVTCIAFCIFPPNFFLIRFLGIRMVLHWPGSPEGSIRIRMAILIRI